MEALNRAATEWLAARFAGSAEIPGDDSFGLLVEAHFPDDAAMRHLARIVRGATAPERFDVMPESAGLRAIADGSAIAEVADAVPAALDAILASLRARIAAGEPLETDPLLDRTTGLPNRILFLDRVANAIAFAHRHDTLLAVCSIRFELDEVSQHVPRVAREVADRLRHTFREIDTIARMSTDEFCIIITDAPTREDAQIAIGKLPEVLSEPFDIGDRAYDIAAHIGISFYPSHGHDAASLLDGARRTAAVAPAVSFYEG